METPASDQLITDAPLTAEAREIILRETFDGDLPHDGKLFVPDDEFYVSTAPQKQARAMCDQLCVWLGIPKRHIGLVFEADAHDVNDASRYRIFIESDVLRNEYTLGATIAHALVRYLLEDRKHIRLEAREQQAALIATASILFGLGIVITNGLLPRYLWLEAAGLHQRLKLDLLGPVQPEQYHQQLRAYLKRYRIPTVYYAASCMPWTAQRLGIKLPKRTTHAVFAAKHTIHLTRLKVIGTVWLVIVILAMAGFTLLHRVAPINRTEQAAQDQATMYKQLSQLCHDTVAYDKQYTDTSDLMAERAINARETRCKSLDNQYQSAQNYLDSLSK